MRWWSRSKDYIFTLFTLWLVYVWISAVVVYFSAQSKPAWHLFNIDVSGLIVINALIISVFSLFFMPYYIVSSLWPLVVSLVRRARRRGGRSHDHAAPPSNRDED